MKNNDNYQFLKNNGFDVDVRSGDSGFAVMYLVMGGKRLNDKKVHFKDNKQARDMIVSKLETARDFTHLGNALQEMKAIAYAIMVKEFDGVYAKTKDEMPLA